MRDNEESKIEVAQEVPFLTGQYTSNTGQATAFQTIQREQVGTIMSVTPQISEGDSVVLKVEIEVSSLAASSAGAVDLITNKRTVKTTVLIPDGGTLVIGGLIEDKATNSEQRVPWLSRIPLIGELFKVRDTSKGKTNLMVFLQPHILHDDREAALETDSKYEYLRDQQRKVGHDSAVLPLAPFQKLDPHAAAQPPGVEPAAAPAAPAGAAAAPAPRGAARGGRRRDPDARRARPPAAPPPPHRQCPTRARQRAAPRPRRKPPAIREQSALNDAGAAAPARGASALCVRAPPRTAGARAGRRLGRMPVPLAGRALGHRRGAPPAARADELHARSAR